MSQRVTVAPFHRRVLPWIFIVVFLAVAPAVVFYTAGYRWNSAKGKVERNGTVILDSTPSGATITIDGQPYSSKSPSTIQDVSPGLHQFSVTKAGYDGWSKSLEVHSELVTFANNIWLWKESQPAKSSADDAFLVSAAPDRQSVLELMSSTPTQAIVRDANGKESATFGFPKTVSPGSTAIWEPSGRYVLIEAPLDESSSWLVDTRAAHAPEELPAGTYRWEKNGLVGTDGTQQLTIDLSNFAVSNLDLPTDIVDQTSGAELRTAPGTNQVVYVSTNNLNQGFILPSGNWRFWGTDKDETILRDGTHWLSLQTSKQPPDYHAVSGDMLRTFTSNGLTHELLVNGTEIWTWDPGAEPQLIYRQSAPIVGAQWHEAGNDIFFATATDIYALNLDPRDGYLITHLAHFDAIKSFTALTKQLLVSGTENGQSGVWTLDLE
ncbi:MAG: PEGA domain-containing protein [Patescibacteria group bacterium]